MTTFNFIKIIKNRLIRLVWFLFLILNNPTHSEIQKILIKNCYDGDTCTSLSGEKIRLACIDTPELKGKRSESEKALLARNYLNKFVKNQKITIKRITTDSYGRTVAELYKDKKNIQKHLVDIGLAEIYEKYAHQCEWTKNYLKEKI